LDTTSPTELGPMASIQWMYRLAALTHLPFAVSPDYMRSMRYGTVTAFLPHCPYVFAAPWSSRAFFAFVRSRSAVRYLDRSLRPKCHLFIRSMQARRHSRCTASRSRRAARDASSSCIYGDSVFNPRRPCSGALVSPLPREEKARALFPSPICAPKDCGHVPGVC